MRPKKDLFSQYHLSQIPQLSLSLLKPQQKVPALLQGILLRKKILLYKGKKDYYEDLQRLLQYHPDIDQVIQIFKKSNVLVSKDKKYVNVQCSNCGKYTQVYKYCIHCQDTHYCSQGCEMKFKLTHEREQCKPIPYPRIHSSVQIQIHFGSDLGNNLQVYFQHEGKMMSAARGKAIIETLCNFLKNKPMNVLDSYDISIVDNYLRMKQLDQTHYITGIQDVKVEGLNQIKNIYEKNPILKQIQLYLYRQGSLMKKVITEIHNNHIHIIYVFTSP